MWSVDQQAAVHSLLEPPRLSAKLAAQSCLAFGELTCKRGAGLASWDFRTGLCSQKQRHTSTLFSTICK